MHVGPPGFQLATGRFQDMGFSILYDALVCILVSSGSHFLCLVMGVNYITIITMSENVYSACYKMKHYVLSFVDAK
jgi:hypothetical protein